MAASKLRVCVIGAGATGLIAARYLRAVGASVTVYEQSNRLGGTWVYEPKPGGLSSMYRDLRTNLPKQLMRFAGHNYPASTAFFPGWSEVVRYLESYAQMHELVDDIRFNSVVTAVGRKPAIAAPARQAQELEEGPEEQSEGDKWLVSAATAAPHSTTRDKLPQTVHTQLFDAVVVCNGHFSQPYSPDLPGADKFPGRLIHSHDYREPEPYQGQNVVVLGAGNSGIDIAAALTGVAKTAVLSHRRDKAVFPPSAQVKEAPAIAALHSDGSVEFTDGSMMHSVDSVLLCTGYVFDYPFLQTSAGSLKAAAEEPRGQREGEALLHIREGKHVLPLYKQILHAKHSTTLAFIGMTRDGVTFPNYERQARYVAAVLSGQIELPSQQERQKEAQGDLDLREATATHEASFFAHSLGARQWDYMLGLEQLVKGCDLGDAGTGEDDPHSQLGYLTEVYEYAKVRRTADPTTFRDLEGYAQFP